MRKELKQEVEIPEGVEVMIEPSGFVVKGSENEVKKDINFRKLDIRKEGNKIIIEHKKATKTEKKMMNTIAAHLKNMIKGAQGNFEYELRICFSHFPFTVDIQGDKVTIKNFLGEKIDRHTTIPEGAKVEVNKDIITVTSANKEIAGQAAANFEAATRITGRDRRVFQDGIFITKKAGKEI